MSVYIDKLKWQPHMGIKWCHLFANTLEELHKAATRIGLKREWFQSHPYPHYDLVTSKRMLAIQNGALETTTKEWLRKQKGD